MNQRSNTNLKEEEQNKKNGWARAEGNSSAVHSASGCASACGHRSALLGHTVMLLLDEWMFVLGHVLVHGKEKERKGYEGGKCVWLILWNEKKLY